jgi:cysteine desulfurase / selenocysteine lyase
MRRAQKLVRMGSIESPWRLDFPIMTRTMNGKPFVYLDSGASAQKPYAVINKMNDVMEDMYANVHRGLYQFSSELTAQFEAVRDRVAKFIGAPSGQNIIFTKNATEAVNLVAQSYGRAHLAAGDEILLTQMEHHANIVPWQLLASEKGLVIKVLPITPEGTLDISELKNLITARTKIFAVTHISNVLGVKNDIASLVAQARALNPNIKILVDGAQGVVHASVNVRQLDVDFYVFTGHKLYGPTGIGVLYAKTQVMAEMPPWQGGGDMIDTVSFEGTTYRDGPARYEAGTPAIIEVLGLGAAIDYVAQIGMRNIAAHEEKLTGEMMMALSEVPGLTIYGPREDRAGIFAFHADWGQASDIATILDQCGVAVRAGHHCAMPLCTALGVTGTVRASLGMYNNSDDIAALVSGLQKAREMLS